MISEDEVLAKALLRIAIITTPEARNVSNETPPGLAPRPPWSKAQLEDEQHQHRVKRRAQTASASPTFQKRRVSRRQSVQRPSQFTAPYCRGPATAGRGLESAVVWSASDPWPRFTPLSRLLPWKCVTAGQTQARRP